MQEDLETRVGLSSFLTVKVCYCPLRRSHSTTWDRLCSGIIRKYGLTVMHVEGKYNLVRGDSNPTPLPCQAPDQRQLIDIQRYWQPPLALQGTLRNCDWTQVVV